MMGTKHNIQSYVHSKKPQKSLKGPDEKQHTTLCGCSHPLPLGLRTGEQFLIIFLECRQNLKVIFCLHSVYANSEVSWISWPN